MSTITLKRVRPALKQDLEPARWWAVLCGDEGDLTKRVEIAWGQDPIFFGVAQRRGYARRLLILDAEDGNIWIEGAVTPQDCLLANFLKVSVHNVSWPGR